MFLFSIRTTENQRDPQGRPSPDEGLILRIAEGEKEALAELYMQTDSAVYGFALSILKNRQDAEDAMQEAYLRIYAGAGSYRPQGKPMAWILTIVKNCALGRLREKKRTPITLEEEGEAWLPGDFTADEADRQILSAAIKHLSDEERQIIILHAVAGLKHREIASLTTAPLSTVLSKYQRALSKLRQILKEEE